MHIKEIPDKHPFVSLRKENEYFGYQYVGKTDTGIHILLTSDWGGGSGVFRRLMFVVFEIDKGIVCDWEKLSIHSAEERLLIKKLGEIGLGDRWSGELRVDGNKLFVGKDEGWFTVSGGTGGGWLSYNLKDRILSIDIDPTQTVLWKGN
jgi:hypothetical protein